MFFRTLHLCQTSEYDYIHMTVNIIQSSELVWVIFLLMLHECPTSDIKACLKWRRQITLKKREPLFHLMCDLLNTRGSHFRKHSMWPQCKEEHDRVFLLLFSLTYMISYVLCKFEGKNTQLSWINIKHGSVTLNGILLKQILTPTLSRCDTRDSITSQMKVQMTWGSVESVTNPEMSDRTSHLGILASFYFPTHPAVVRQRAGIRPGLLSSLLGIACGFDLLFRSCRCLADHIQVFIRFQLTEHLRMRRNLALLMKNIMAPLTEPPRYADCPPALLKTDEPHLFDIIGLWWFKCYKYNLCL